MKFIIKNFNFMSKRKYAIILSITIITISITSLIFKGLNLGIDFSGGTIIEAKFQKEININDIRKKLLDNNYSNASVQFFGSNTDILIRLQTKTDQDASLGSKILNIINNSNNLAKIRRIDFVGPKLGEELANDGGLAFLYAIIGILIYVAFRFEYRFALASVVALFHDIIISLGIYSLLGLEFDLTVLAALLAVVGYSLNDTIVVFDRIREEIKKKNNNIEIIATINNSINNMFTRTLVTSLTTLFVLICLFFIGGKTIHGFSAILIVGVIVGTYSSIFVASTTALGLGINKNSLLPSEKEKKEIDSRP